MGGKARRMSELKPCPFCGGKADLLDYGLTGARKVVQCSDCGAKTRAFDPKVKRGENAIDAWNSRVCDDDCVSRQAAIDSFKLDDDGTPWSIDDIVYRLEQFPSAEELPSAQPDGIPLEWIDKHLEWLDNCDNDFAQLAKVGIRAMVEIWKKDKT